MSHATETTSAGAVPLSVPAIIYTRVSDTKQLGRRFESCESQAAICRDLIQRHEKEGWHELAYFTDPAYTGANMRRPGMEALMRLVATGGVRKVVIFKLERVLRSTDEWAPFRAFLQKHGCELVSALEDISERTALGRLKNNILVSVSEYDRLNIGEKVRAKMQEQAKRGYWNGGSVPFGYAYDKNTQTLKPDAVDAPVVRRIFEHAAQLGSLTDLANALNAEGFRTKLRPVRRRDGTEETIGNRLWRSDTLRLLINNPLYRGVVRYAGTEYSAQHEPLVSRGVWEQANAASQQTQTRPADVIVERDRHGHVLKGIAFCGHCRRTLVPHASGISNNAGKRYRYYNCGFVLRERQPRACPVGRLSADGLEGAVLGFLGQVSRHPQLVAGVLEATRTRSKGDRHAIRAELEKTDKSLADVGKELSNCVDAVAKGGLEVLGETLKNRVQLLRTQQQGLLVERERRRQELVATEDARLDEQRIRSSLERLGSLLPRLEFEEQKELVRLFVQRVEVNEVVGKKGGETPRPVPHDPARVLAVRIKLHLPALVQGIEERESITTRLAKIGPVAARGAIFETQVDFSRAMHGEITITAPFNHSVVWSQRSRLARPQTAATNVPVTKHPVVRAQEWQRLLDTGEVTTRSALAKRFGMTPGGVTRIMKLVEVLPEIQAYLAALKTREEQRHFTVKKIGELAALPAEMQREAMERLRRNLPYKAMVAATGSDPKAGLPPSEPDDARIVAYLKKHGTSFPRFVRVSLGLSRMTTYRRLTELVASGKVVAVGRTRNTAYAAIGI
jgi:DNA invertase Pin-like site-specific DNA recombinase